ncbi:MAG: PKD domain-containing protein [Chitinophagaceae bacterium]
MRIETSPSMLVTKNKIFMSAANGQVVRALIIASTTSTAASPTMVSNNWIVNSGGSGDCTGLAVYNCNYLNFVNNNVLITSPLTSSAAYYHYPQYTNTYIRLINNNLINKGSGYAYSVTGSNTSDLDTLDYNNLFSSGTYLANWAGTTYTSLSGLQSASSKDVNSISVDPGYISPTNLHVSNIGLNKKAMKYPWVPVDIDNELRDTMTPDIGADEFFPVSNDVGINSVDSPMVFCAGTRNVRVKFQNFGIDTIKSVRIQWQINSSTQTSYNWTGTLAPGASSASLILGSYTFAANTPYTIKAWTLNPNNLTDGRKSNDTLSVTRYPGMSGTYKISDSLNADFKSFNSAIAAFTARGICGPITFRVAPGTYNEQITLLQLPGMGASNPITFISMDKDSSLVRVVLPSTVATGNNNATIQLRGADYIHFKGITFERTGTNIYALVVHILNGSTHNTFRNCQMIGLPLSAANNNAINIWSDQGQDDYNEFHNNYVKFGQYSVSYSGLSSAHEVGTVFRGNTFDSAYNSSVQVIYNDAIDFSNNIFKRIITPITSNYSLQLTDCDLAVRVMSNKFIDQGAENSIVLTSCNATSGNPGFVANNAISKASGKGIVLDGVDYQTVAFNSIYLNAANSANYGIYSTVNTTTNLVMKSNNMLLEGGQAFFIPSASQVSASDYNNLMIKGGAFAYWGASYTNLNDLSVASGKDINTKSVNPLFKSSTDLHISNPVLKGAGAAVTGITTDFDGELRNSTNPDIGADEFKLMDHDAGVVEMTGPGSGACAGLQSIEIVIQNFGGDTLTSADIKWMVGNVTQTTYKWTGNLLNKQKDTIVIGTYNFFGNLNPKFTIWTDAPNGQSDAINFNDTLILNRSVRALPVANAGNDISICNGDFAVIGPNTQAGFSYRWYDLGANLLGTTSKISVGPSTQTAYVLEVTNSTFGCKKNDTVVISVNPTPQANAGTDKTVCYGNSVQIGAAPQTGFNYSWSSIPAGYSSNIANPVVSTLQTIKYVLVKSAVSTGCYDTDTVQVNVALSPTPNITGTGAACEGDRFLYSTPGANGNTFVWTVNGGQIISGQSSNSINVRWTSAGSASLSVIQTNTVGCKDTVGYNVSVYQRPTAKFNVVEDCEGGSTRFEDSSLNANSYNWNFGDGNSSFQKNPIHNYDSLKTYIVRLVAIGNGNCSDTTYRTASVFPLPVSDFTFVKTAGRTYQFTDNSTVQSGAVVAWDWQMGDGNKYITQNPLHEYGPLVIGQNYSVVLCATTDKGCRTCISKQLTVTSIEEDLSSAGIAVYPNPSFGQLTVVSANLIETIDVYNSIGQRVMNMKSGNTREVLNIEGLSAGVYTLEVQTEKGRTQIKINKQ